MSGKKEADLVGDVSGTPYFLLRLLTDLSLVPDSEVMLEVRGERTPAAASHSKKDHRIDFN